MNRVGLSLAQSLNYVLRKEFALAKQLPLFSLDMPAVFPSTRYQGSKAKLSEWIWKQIAALDFHTCLDAFGGTGAIAFRLKQAGKAVTYNDLLRFNYLFGLAFIENNHTRLTDEDVAFILASHPDIDYPTFVQDTFPDIYFTDGENAWLDRTITNLRRMTDPFKYALAFFALCQACIVKRPYNLFHRKNLYMRLADVERSFGNKASWDRSFEEWFREFVTSANLAVFDNGQINCALNLDAMEAPGNYDLVYIDTPYISRKGVGVDYHSFYHFLEGIAMYDEWAEHIDYKSKHRRLRRRPSEWVDKNLIRAAFDRLFQKFQYSHLVISYRSDGIPSIDYLEKLLKRHKNDVRVEYFGEYKYVLSTNSCSKEVLLIAT